MNSRHSPIPSHTSVVNQSNIITLLYCLYSSSNQTSLLIFCFWGCSIDQTVHSLPNNLTWWCVVKRQSKVTKSWKWCQNTLEMSKNWPFWQIKDNSVAKCYHLFMWAAPQNIAQHLVVWHSSLTLDHLSQPPWHRHGKLLQVAGPESPPSCPHLRLQLLHRPRRPPLHLTFQQPKRVLDGIAVWWGSRQQCWPHPNCGEEARRHLRIVDPRPVLKYWPSAPLDPPDDFLHQLDVPRTVQPLTRLQKEQKPLAHAIEPSESHNLGRLWEGGALVLLCHPICTLGNPHHPATRGGFCGKIDFIDPPHPCPLGLGFPKLRLAPLQPLLFLCISQERLLRGHPAWHLQDLKQYPSNCPRADLLHNLPKVHLQLETRQTWHLLDRRLDSPDLLWPIWLVLEPSARPSCRNLNATSEFYSFL